MTQSLKIECLVTDLTLEGEVASFLVTKEQLTAGLSKKADLVDGKIQESNLPDFIANNFQTINQKLVTLDESITDGIQSAKDYSEAYVNEKLIAKADLVDGKVPQIQLPSVEQYEGLNEALNGVLDQARRDMIERTDEIQRTKADLGEDGKVVREQLPNYDKIPGLESVIVDLNDSKADISDVYKKSETLNVEEIEATVERISPTRDEVEKSLMMSEVVQVHGFEQKYVLAGGYPFGAVLTLDDGITEVVSAINNNKNNPNENVIGWKPHGVGKFITGMSYGLNSEVILTNGNKVKSTIADNTVNPNVDMGGWDLASIRRVRTPEQYGADGTPEKDTTAWVRMCSDLQDGEEIRASGAYKISGGVVKISNKRGFRLDISGARFYQQSKFSRTITIEDCTKFTVKDGEFWGRGGGDAEFNGASTSYNGVAGIFLDRCDYPLIVGNHLYDHAGGSIVWRETNNLMILNNTVKGIGSDYIKPGDNGQDFAIGGYTNDRSRRDFVATISGNTISGTAFGIFANSCKSLIINGNTIDSIPGQHGVYLIECDGVSAYGNTIQNCYLSAFKLQLENYAGQMGLAEPKLHLHGFSYAGNIIRNCIDGLEIISTSLSDGTDQKVFGVVVSGNTIESVMQDGMVLNHCVDANIGVNTINGAARSGVNFINSSGKLLSNTILKTGSSGIFISAYNDVELNDNTLVDVGLNNLSGVGFDHPIFSEVTIKPLPSQKSNPTISLDSNRITFTSGDAASTSLMYFADPRTKIEIVETRTNSTKPVRISGNLVYCANNDFYGFYAGSQTSPTTFIAGHGRREFHGSQNPQTALSTKAFAKGDICWNTDTITGQYVGWVCVNSGSPGAWQGFGAVGVTQMPAISNSVATDVAGVNIVLNQLLAALKSSRLMLN